jgi:hypothetical protein
MDEQQRRWVYEYRVIEPGDGTPQQQSAHVEALLNQYADEGFHLVMESKIPGMLLMERRKLE